MTKCRFQLSRWGFLVLALSAPMWSGCGRSESAAGGEIGQDELSGRLVITGSSTCAPLVAQIARRFEAEHPGVRIDVQTGGSSRGIADARRGTADIGMASRALSDDEKTELVPYTIAFDGVCMIVHADNPVDQLSDDQVRDIYLGRIANWQAVGGPDAEITVVNKAAGRATLEVFVNYFELDEKDILADVIIGDNEQGIKTVAGNPYAIGYVSVGTAEYDAGHGTSIKLLPTNDIAATTENVAAGTFPIGRPLNCVTSGEATGLAKTFIDYCRSSNVHDIIRELYFVPIR